MFFIPCDNWKTLFFIQIYRYQEVSYNGHVAAFFETSVLKEIRILYPLSPQQRYNTADTKGPKQSFYFLNAFKKIYLFTAFFTLSVCERFTPFFNS